jgi:hypothetical protein
MMPVEWCGLQQEVVQVADGDGGYSEIPALGGGDVTRAPVRLDRPHRY